MDKLVILKADLQMLTKSNDEYLKTLIDLSEKAIQREGITIKADDIEYEMAVVQYAAYLFRKRAAPDTAMPRYLRYMLNNMLISQKGGSHDV